MRASTITSNCCDALSFRLGASSMESMDTNESPLLPPRLAQQLRPYPTPRQMHAPPTLPEPDALAVDALQVVLAQGEDFHALRLGDPLAPQLLVLPAQVVEEGLGDVWGTGMQSRNKAAAGTLRAKPSAAAHPDPHIQRTCAACSPAGVAWNRGVDGGAAILRVVWGECLGIYMCVGGRGGS